MGEIRVPVQERSILKRNKIIEMGFKLICDKGYYNITTVDIAKYAGVSTGIVYQYFADKKDVLIEGIRRHADLIAFPALNVIDKYLDEKPEVALQKTIETYIEQHIFSKNVHKEIVALSYIDKDVEKVFVDIDRKMNEKAIDTFSRILPYQENLDEKIHLALGIIDGFCHDYAYYNRDYLDYDVLRSIVYDTVINMLKPGK